MSISTQADTVVPSDGTSPSLSSSYIQGEDEIENQKRGEPCKAPPRSRQLDSIIAAELVMLFVLTLFLLSVYAWVFKLYDAMMEIPWKEIFAELKCNDKTLAMASEAPTSSDKMSAKKAPRYWKEALLANKTIPEQPNNTPAVEQRDLFHEEALDRDDDDDFWL